jgi:curved DNA-binding protein
VPKDYYDSLGVAKGATTDEIKSAYRKLARQYHPDRNPGDKEAAARFKEVQEAYDVLSDKDKRAKYDQFGHAAFEGPAGGPGGFGGGPGGYTYSWSGPGGAEGIDPAAFQSIFEQMFGAGASPFGNGPTRARGKGRGRRAAVPQDVQQEIDVEFLTAARGGAVDVRTPGGATVSLKIPPGIESGKTLRIRGQGINGGDLLVQVHVRPHPYFRREGSNLILDLPLSLAEAVLGGKVDVPTLEGTVTLTIPPGTSSGKRLRLREKGLPRPGGGKGDLYVEARVIVPANLDAKSTELITEFIDRNPQHPRAGMRW